MSSFFIIIPFKTHINGNIIVTSDLMTQIRHIFAGR